MGEGSKPSLVFPGIIMEVCAFCLFVFLHLFIAYCKLMFVCLLQAWVFSHFPSLLKGPPHVELTYPAVRAWATCDRSAFKWTYDEVRVALNSMTMDKVSVFVFCCWCLRVAYRVLNL